MANRKLTHYGTKYFLNISQAMPFHVFLPTRAEQQTTVTNQMTHKAEVYTRSAQRIIPSVGIVIVEDDEAFRCLSRWLRMINILSVLLVGDGDNSWHFGSMRRNVALSWPLEEDLPTTRLMIALTMCGPFQTCMHRRAYNKYAPTHQHPLHAEVNNKNTN